LNEVIIKPKPVWETDEFFVQIAYSAIKDLPKLIEQEIYYSNDTKSNFKIKIKTFENKTEFSLLNPSVKTLIISSKVKTTG
jgi:hypothetical protein